LQTTKIKLPRKIIPFKDEKLQQLLETKMRLFENLEKNEKFKSFFSKQIIEKKN